MKNIYTSYFANWRNFPKDSIPISIARVTPRGFNGECFAELAPSEFLLENYKCGMLTKSLYEKMYKKFLEGLDKDKIIAELSEISGGADIILLCYETPEDFCHRHFVAEWLGCDELG